MMKTLPKLEPCGMASSNDAVTVAKPPMTR